MWQTWELFVLGCIVSSARSQIDSTFSPQNLSLSWIDDFHVNLSWVAPENFPKDCEFEWSLCGTRKEVADCDGGFHSHDPKRMSYNFDQNLVIMDGASLSFSLQTDCTDCEQNTSAESPDCPRTEPVFHNITYPDLVENFQCSMTSCTATSCSWSLASHAPDLSFFYKKVRENAISAKSPREVPYLQECSDYLDTADGRRTGCPLQGINSNHNVYFLFNGTLNGSPVRNTFTGINVMPPPLNLTVAQEGDQDLSINWTVPDLANCITDWKFIIDYTVCNEKKASRTAKPPTSSVSVPFLPHCLYNITIRSNYLGGMTASEEILYGDPRNLHAFMIAAAVVLPLVLAIFAVLSFVCFRKYKDKILPKVPEPRDFLRDMFNNNNEISSANLYILPQEDEAYCMIDLVLEPQPDC